MDPNNNNQDIPDDDELNGEELENAAGGDDGAGSDGNQGDDDGDGGDDEGNGEEGAEAGTKANERIRKLIKEKKELQNQLKNAQALAGDDGKAILRAAEVTGILPGLMSKEEASAFADMDTLPGVIKAYKRWVRAHDKGDEYEAGGKTMTYADVQDRIDDLEETQEQLKEKYGERRKALEAEVKEIYTLGLKAKQAGWKPDGEAPKNKKPKPGDAPNRSRPKPPASVEKPEDIEVEDPDDFEQYLIAEERRKKNKHV